MIQYVQLITGDEVIADITTDNDYFYLKHPVKIGLTREGLAMMPFSPFIKNNEIRIPTKHILFHAEVEDEIRNAYNSRFGSGIVVAGAGMQI